MIAIVHRRLGKARSQLEDVLEIRRQAKSQKLDLRRVALESTLEDRPVTYRALVVVNQRRGGAQVCC